MTAGRLHTRDLPQVLEDLAMAPDPEYIDEVLATTARTRQRPAWTFPGWWLPAIDVARQSTVAPHLHGRSILVALLLIALLLAAVSLMVGTQRRVPAPFGLARNGVVAYEAGGDIYTVDPVTGVATAIVSGPETDVGPRFSRDGTQIVFERKADGGGGRLYVAQSDGSDIRLITPDPIFLQPGDYGRGWERYQFSPDGNSVLIAAYAGAVPTIAIAQSDGSGVRQLRLGAHASEPSFRPPDGAEILFVGRSLGDRGLFAVDPTSGTVRPIVKVAPSYDLAGASWSPDGSRIAYWTWNTTVEGLTAKSRVVNADGSGDRELPSPEGAVWNAHATWSNDGTQLFIARAYTRSFDDVRGVVLPADGSSAGTEVAPAGSVETGCCAAWMWSPDDSKVLGRTGPIRRGSVRYVVIDLAAREARPAPWTSASDPSWQRLAPWP